MKFGGGFGGDKHSDQSTCHLPHLADSHSILSVSQESSLGITLDFSLFNISGNSINYTLKTYPESATLYPFTVTAVIITCLNYCNNLQASLHISALAPCLSAYQNVSFMKEDIFFVLFPAASSGHRTACRTFLLE